MVPTKDTQHWKTYEHKIHHVSYVQQQLEEAIVMHGTQGLKEEAMLYHFHTDDIIEDQDLAVHQRKHGGGHHHGDDPNLAAKHLPIEARSSFRWFKIDRFVTFVCPSAGFF